MKEKIDASFSQHLCVARKRKGWTQRELVDQLRRLSLPLFVGFDTNALSRWENNKIQPKAERMVRIFRVLEYSIEEVKACVFLPKSQLLKRYQYYCRDNFCLTSPLEKIGEWELVSEKNLSCQFLKQLCSISEYEPFIDGTESIEQLVAGEAVLASLTYRVENDKFFLIHTESISHSAFLSYIERLIELLYVTRTRFFFMVAPEKKTVKQVRLFQLKDAEMRSGIYSARTDYVLGELLTILSWNRLNRTNVVNNKAPQLNPIFHSTTECP